MVPFAYNIYWKPNHQFNVNVWVCIVVEWSLHASPGPVQIEDKVYVGQYILLSIRWQWNCN